MCGRFVITSPGTALAALFGTEERLNLPARHNVAPTQDVPIVRAVEGAMEGAVEGAAGGRRRMSMARWGLIPAWAKAPFAKGGIAAATLINARADTIAAKPAFRSAFKARRCLMPADGFYEWREDVEPKQPYRIGLAAPGGGFRPFAIAGIWERWQDAGPGKAAGEVAGASPPLESCALITDAAAPPIAFIHHRMPVILDPADWDAWLDPATPAAALQALLRPTRQALAWHPVSRRVNAVRADDPGLLDPVPEPAAPAPAAPAPAAAPAERPAGAAAGPAQGSLL